MPSTPSETEIIYRGYRGRTGGSLITVQTSRGEQIGMVVHVVRHSPAGMSWGYPGSAAADTARSLLIAALGEDAARCPACLGTGRVVYDIGADGLYDAACSEGDDPKLIFNCVDCDDGIRRLPYQDFKAAYVTRWGERWKMSRTAILKWLTHAERETGLES